MTAIQTGAGLGSAQAKKKLGSKVTPNRQQSQVNRPGSKARPSTPAQTTVPGTVPAPPTPTPPAADPAPTPTPPVAATDPRNTDAFQLMQATLKQYGLDSLADSVATIIKQGYTDQGAIQTFLEDTPAWKQRFAGNEVRKQNGLSVLSVADYLNLENGYKTVIRNAGLPAGFYDGKDAVDNWIGNNVSVQELGDRVQTARAMLNQVDPNTRAQFRNYYGVDDGHLMAYFLDPKKGEDILNQQAAAAQVGAYGADQGLHVDRTRAEQYAQSGLSQDQVRSGFADAASVVQGGEDAIAARFGQTYGQNDAMDEFLGGLASAQRKRRQLNQQEQSLFSSQGGAGDSLYHEGYGLASDASGQF